MFKAGGEKDSFLTEKKHGLQTLADGFSECF